MERQNQLRTLKKALRAFMQKNYTTERLSWLLAHAQSEKLSYQSCCCFIGIATANHALMSMGVGSHYNEALAMPGGLEADRAYLNLGMLEDNQPPSSENKRRRRIIIPMIQAELRRREREHRFKTPDSDIVNQDDLPVTTGCSFTSDKLTLVSDSVM